ncbi:major facilitator superfamily domain-containing protein [Phthorimaea operculella]|nr:major facilitator superfamily domain-containing protein [Phthorimaea operculella]
MSDAEEELSQSQRSTGRIMASNPQVNVISELPGKRYGITMEVPMFLCIVSISLSSVAISNIIMYRTCVHALHYDDDVCQPFLSPGKANVSSTVETEVQRYTTFISTVKSVLESIVPAILSLFLGTWSDTHGRKPLVVWSLFGLCLSQMMIVVYSLLGNYGPWWFILTSIPTSLTGGFTVLFTGAMCYINDISTTADRSLRMTIVQAVVSLGSVIGGVASSYLLKLVGNVYLLLIVAALNVIAYAYTNVYIKESLTGAIQGGILSVMDFLLVKEMFRECFKRRPNKGRAQILLLTFANCLSVFIMYGGFSLDYLYTRKKLQWSMKEYTIFSAAGTTISFIGCFVGVGLIQKILPVSDLAFTLIAFLSAMTECFVRAFASTGWHMYLGASIAAFKGLSSPLIRSFLSKILPLEDIAKVFALIGAIEGIAPLFSPVIYNGLYNVTLQTFPGAMYILSACITLCCAVMVMLVQYYRWRMPTAPSYRPLDE